MARPHLQTHARWQGARHARPVRQAIETVRLDSRDGMSIGESDLRRGTAELARAEIDPEAVMPAYRHLRGAQATKQSTLVSLRAGLLRGACHRARIRATRWLAMTARTPNQRI